MSSQLDSIFIKRLMGTLKTMNNKRGGGSVQSMTSSAQINNRAHSRAFRNHARVARVSLPAVSYGSICILTLCIITIVLILIIAYTIVTP